jgi:hypothetical protein
MNIYTYVCVCVYVFLRKITQICEYLYSLHTSKESRGSKVTTTSSLVGHKTLVAELWNNIINARPVTHDTYAPRSVRCGSENGLPVDRNATRNVKFRTVSGEHGCEPLTTVIFLFEKHAHVLSVRFVRQIISPYRIQF